MQAVGAGIVPYKETVIRGFPGTGTGVTKPYNPKDDINKAHGDTQDLWSKVIAGSWDIQWDRYEKVNPPSDNKETLMFLAVGLIAISMLFGR